MKTNKKTCNKADQKTNEEIFKMSSKDGSMVYLVCGIIFLLITLVYGTASISTGNFPSGLELMVLSMTVMCFCLSYLYPQFKDDDERSKRIKERGMFISYFFILGYMMVLMPILYYDWIVLTSYQTVSLLASLTIMTVFLSFVFLARRY